MNTSSAHYHHQSTTVDSVSQSKSLSEKPIGVNYSNTPSLQHTKVDNLPSASVAMNTIGLPIVAHSHASISKSSISHSPAAGPNAYPYSISSSFATPQSHVISNNDNDHQVDAAKVTLPPEAVDKSSRETYGNSATEMARKSPPPYHVAARRAAFFRSSGGAGTGRIDSPTLEMQGGNTRASPIVGRMFPLPLPMDSLVYSNKTASVASSVSSPMSDVPLSQDEDVKEATNKGNVNEYRKGDEDIDKVHLRPVVDHKDGDDSDGDGDAISSSTEEHLDAGSSLDLDKRPIDSKNLVKTIESALEKVDKRTTEFLKDDRWQDLSQEEDQDAEADFPPPPSEEEIMYSNVAPPEIDQTDSIADKKQEYPTSTTYQGPKTHKGPVVPPKPSPLLSRTQPTSSEFQDQSLVSTIAAAATSNRTESRSMIPSFASSSLSSSKLSNSFTSPIGSSTSSSVDNDTVEPTHSSLSVGFSSRIPKLPSLTTSFQRYPASGAYNASLANNNDLCQSKPIPSPKPSIIRGSVVSKIPSIGATESPKRKDESSHSSLPITITQKSSIIPSPYSSSSSGNQNADSDGTNSKLEPGNININDSSAFKTGTKIPRFESASPEKQESNINTNFNRMGSGRRIPKANENTKTITATTSSNKNLDSSFIVTNNMNMNENDTERDSSSSLSNTPSLTGCSGVSRIPSIGKKRWYFGTHKNTRVVAIEFKKINSLGFSVSDASGAGQAVDGNGIYVIDTDSADSSLRIGDKILQVDGIDVANMGIEIVKKILSNCQDTINLLVSRQS